MPLYYESLVQPRGIEPLSTTTYMVGGLGIEPNSSALQADAEITRLAHLPKTFGIVLCHNCHMEEHYPHHINDGLYCAR